MSPAVLVLIITAIAIILFVTEKIPVNLTIMLVMISLVVTKLVKPAEAVSGFASTTILMLIGVVIVGSALFETGVSDRIAEVVTKYAKTERIMITSILILSSFMSSFLSNSGTIAVFIPIIIGICQSTNFSRSKLLMATFLGAMAGGRLTIVGDAAINVLIGNQIQELGYPFGFFEITKIGLPLTIILVLYIYFIGYRFLPDVSILNKEDIFSSIKKTYDKKKQIISVVILITVVIGMIFEKQTGIPSYMVAIIGAVLTAIFGIFKEKQIYQLVDIKTVILLGGMKPLALALDSTGASQIIANQLINIIGNSTNIYYITVIIFLLTTIMTQFMSNVVTVTLLMPIIIAIANTINVVPSALIMILCVGSTMSILTPIACPPANLIYSYGGYKFSDYFKSNWLLSLIFLIACVILIPIIWPMF